jgi:hypothetical protein
VLRVLFRLDYISCFLTVVSTLLVGRKQWSGLALAGINSAIVCVIGVRTAQFGFIPANVFCIGMYAWSVRSWRRERKIASDAAETDASASHQPRVKAALLRWTDRPGRLLAYSTNSYERLKRQATERLVRVRSAAAHNA